MTLRQGLQDAPNSSLPWDHGMPPAKTWHRSLSVEVLPSKGYGVVALETIMPGTILVVKKALFSYAAITLNPNYECQP